LSKSFRGVFEILIYDMDGIHFSYLWQWKLANIFIANIL